MSEAEIKKRQDYKRNRKKWIMIQIIILSVIAVIALASFVTYDRMNSTYHIKYTESGSADYRVQYTENDFFDNEWREDGESYLASLINIISADFNYKMVMDAEDVGFDYRYGIKAQMLITDKDSGKIIFAPEYELVPEKTATLSEGSTLNIRDCVTVDYNKYNDLAKEFVKVYDLKSVTTNLKVSMNVNVLSQCDSFESDNSSAYTVALNIPLNAQTLNINISTSVPTAESKVLARDGAVNQNVFLVLGIVAASLALIAAAVLAFFVYLTRNDDINYTIKVKRLVSAYRSFIQEINGEFDSEGYQIIPIKTFNEMLGIRDTIQSPILMSENRDQTMTQFIIPTSTRLLYVFEIKVDNYDEIYGLGDVIEEAIIVDDSVDIDEVAEAMAEPDVLLSEVEYVEDDDVDYEGTEEHPGVEVVGVVWPERAHKNKVYRYDPNGEQLAEGDMVLVPTHDAGQGKDIIRKAAIAHENHFIDPDLLKHPLKKIIGVIKRRTQAALTPADNTENEPSNEA